MLIWFGKEITPYEVLIDERVEKDLEKVPNYVVNTMGSRGEQFPTLQG